MQATSIDLLIPAGAINLEVRRSLMQTAAGPGLLGASWRLNLERRLVATEAGFDLIDGNRRIRFSASSQDQVYRSTLGERLLRQQDGRLMYERANGNREVFSSDGRLLEIDQRSGNRITFAWSADQLIEVAGPYQKALRMSYDENDRLTRIDASNGRSVQYAYSDGELSVFTDESGIATEYGYDDAGRLLRVATAGFTASTYSYDARGRVTARQWSGDRVERFEYDDEARRVRKTDSAGAVIVYQWSPDLAREEVTDPLGRSSVIEYDRFGHISAMIGPTGKAARFAYDDRGRLMSVTDPAGQTTHFEYLKETTLISKTSCCNGLTQEFAYDDAMNLAAVKTGAVTVTEYSYTKDGLIAAIKRAGTGEQRFEYDGKGRLAATIDSLGHRKRYRYDQADNVIAVVNELGGTTRFEYDDRNRLISRTDPGGGTSRFGYNAAGQLITQTDPLGGKTAYQYDDDGVLVAVTDAAGDTTRISFDRDSSILQWRGPGSGLASQGYDALGRLIAVTDELGLTTSIEYDALGRLVGMRSPSGREFSYRYDDAGRLVSVEDSAAGRVTYTQDERGQVTAVTFPNDATSRFTYSALGAVIRSVDPLGHATNFTYAPGGLLESVGTPSGDETRYGRDQLGRVTTVRHPGRDEIELSYDAMGNLLSSSDPKQQHKYDQAGRRVATRDEAGGVSRFHYDAAGNLVRKQKPDGRKVSYSYGPRGELLSAEDPDFQVSYSYDDQGRLHEVAYPDLDQSIRYEFNERGLVSSLLAAGGQALRYEYNERQLLQSITLPGGEGIALGYDTSGRLTTIGYPNGVTGAISYDDAGRIGSISYRGAGGDTLDAWTYDYDKAYNPVAVERPNGKSRRYAYDASGRLVSERGAGADRSYQYLPGGERGEVQIGNDTITYLYDSRGRILAAGEEEYTHDANGNLLSRTRPDGEAFYEFDDENRLYHAFTTEGVTLAFGYAPSGERVWRDDGATRSYFLNDGLELLQVLDEEGEPATLFVHGPGLDRPLAMIHGGETYYYHADAVGTIAFMTDARGEVAATYDTDAFGRVLAASSEVPNPFIFAGREYEPQLGLYFYRARYYDPALGRFISPDPLPPVVGEPATLNRYTYARNSPIRFGDPLGLYDQETLQWAWEMTNRGIRCMLKGVQLSPDEQSAFELASSILSKNDALNVREQLAGRPIERPKLNPATRNNLPTVPDPGPIVIEPLEAPASSARARGTNSGIDMPPRPSPSRAKAVTGRSPVNPAHRVSVSEALAPGSNTRAVNRGSLSVPSSGTVEVPGPALSPTDTLNLARQPGLKSRALNWLKTGGGSPQLGAGAIGATGLMVIRPVLECQMEGKSITQCAGESASALIKGSIVGSTLMAAGAGVAVKLGQTAVTGATGVGVVLLVGQGAVDSYNLITEGKAYAESWLEARGAAQTGQQAYGEGGDIDARIREMLAKLDRELESLETRGKLIDTGLLAINALATKAREQAGKADQIMEAYGPPDEEPARTTLTGEEVKAACGRADSHLETLRLADEKVDAAAKAIADSIDNAGDAPDSYAPLRRAFREIEALAGTLKGTEGARAGLEADLSTWLQFHAPLVAPKESAASREAGPKPSEQLTQIHVNLKKMVDNAKELAGNIEEDIPAFNSLNQSLEIGIKRLKGVVPDSHADRLQDFDRREFKRASIFYDPAAANTGGTLKSMEQNAARVNRLLIEAEKRQAEEPASDKEPEDVCGDTFDPAQILQQANEHIEAMQASLIAITYVYASRVSKINKNVGDEEKLIIEHSENLRIANGKLKYLEPLIAERRGKTDPNSRQELAKLLNEQGELEQLRAESEFALEQVRQWHTQDGQEQKLVNEQGGAAIATMEQQGKTLTPIQIAGIGGDGPGS